MIFSDMFRALKYDFTQKNLNFSINDELIMNF